MSCERYWKLLAVLISAPFDDSDWFDAWGLARIEFAQDRIFAVGEL